MKRFYSLCLTALLGLVALTASAVNVTINVDDPSRVSVKVSGTEQSLVEGDNVFSVADQSISIEAKDDAFLKSVVRKSTSAAEYVYNNKYCSLYIFASSSEETFTVTSVSAADVRTASVKVKADVASKVRLMRSSTYTYADLADNTEVEVKYIPNGVDGFNSELPLQIMPTDNSMPLYQVTVGGTVVEPNGTTYYISPTGGEEIDIQANFPDMDVPVKFSYVSEEAKGFVTDVTVNGTSVTNYNDANFTVKAGSKVKISGNTADYKFNSMTVGGQSVSYFYGSYEFTVAASDVSVYIDARKYATVKATINIEHPEYVKVYKGYYYNNNVLPMTAGANEIELSETDTRISIKPESGCFINSVKDGAGNSYNADWSGTYEVNVTDGMELTVDAGAIERNETALVYLGVDPESIMHFDLHRQDRSAIEGLTQGYNELKLYSGDNPFGLSWYYEGGTFSNVYLNGEKVSPMYEGSTTYEIRLTDGDVLKVFPVNDPDIYNVAVETTGEGDGKIVVKTDSIRLEENWQEGVAALPGTKVSIQPAEGYTILSVTVDGEAVEADADGVYAFTVNADTRVSVETHRIRPVNATVEIDNPERVTVYEGNDFDGEVLEMKEGANLLEYDEETAITIVPYFDYAIEEVSDNFGVVYDVSGDGAYTIVLKEGMRLAVKTSVIARDLTAVVYVDDSSASDYIKFVRHSKYDVALESGYNVVKFNDEVDSPFDLTFSAAYSNVYLNGETVAPLYDWSTIYSLQLADGDVLKLYLAGNPESCNVAFNVAEGVDEGVSLTRDLIQEVEDWRDGFSALPGTKVSLGGNISVTVNGVAVEPDEDGLFSFTVDADTKVVVNQAGADGIDTLGANRSGTADIYNLEGVCVLRNATAAEMAGLPAGLYIVNGKKVLKR